MPSLQDLLEGMQPLPTAQGVMPGNVLSFHYSLYRHDPYPVVLILEDQGVYLFGINLHYLTFPQIQAVFKQFANFVSYEALKNFPNITQAFRKYKKTGITHPRVKSLESIIQRMKVPRLYPEDEVQHIRDRVLQDETAIAEREGLLPPVTPEAPATQTTPQEGQ